MTDSRAFAVVTGASSGIGFELAKGLAEMGADLLMIAEDDQIMAAAAQLGQDCTPLQADLSTPGGVATLIDAVNAHAAPPDILALNAGVGRSGRFVDLSLDDDLQVIKLNVESTVRLAKAIIPAMVRRGTGRVLITGSIAGDMPGPYYATYAASKAFLNSFSAALRYELRDTGVYVTTLLPGPTDTDFFDEAGMQDTPVYEQSKDDPAVVARQALEALFGGQATIVSGSKKNLAQHLAAGVLSEQAAAGMQAKFTRPRRAKDES